MRKDTSERRTASAPGRRQNPPEADSPLRSVGGNSPHRHLRRAGPWLLLLLAAVLPYVNALHCGFVYDDMGQILENPYVSPKTPWWISLTSPVWSLSQDASIYRPVASLTFRLQRAVAGEAPGSFHAVNLFLHLGVTLLVFVVLRRLAGGRTPLPLAIATLFAMHPIHTEAVTSIVGRSELLAALFGLGGYLIWLRAGSDHRTDRNLGLSIAGAAMCFALAAGSKESSAGWILLLAAHRAGFIGDERSYRAVSGIGQGGLRRALLGDAAVVFGFLLYGLARIAVLGSAVGLSDVSQVDNPIFTALPDVRVLTAGKVLAQGLGLILWPQRLCVDYSFDSIAQESSWLSPAGLFLLLLAAAAFWFVRRGRRTPEVAWGLGFYGALILPASNLLIPIGTIMAERLLYLPSLGILALLLFALDRLFSAIRMRRLALILLIAAALALGLRTWERNRDWQSNRTLFEAAVSVQPRSVKARCNLASALVRAGRLQEAEGHYRRALEIAPSYPLGLNGLGHALIEQERYAEAEKTLRRAGVLNPRNAEARYRLGNLLLELERGREALGVFDQLLSMEPYSREGWVGRASALFLLEDFSASADAWERACALAGSPPEFGRHLAAAQIRAGRLQAATETLRELLTADPQEADLHNELARLLLRMGNPGEEALRAARRAADLEPAAGHLETLLRCLMACGHYEQARRLLSSPEAAALDPAQRKALRDIVPAPGEEALDERTGEVMPLQNKEMPEERMNR